VKDKDLPSVAPDIAKIVLRDAGWYEWDVGLLKYKEKRWTYERWPEWRHNITNSMSLREAWAEHLRMQEQEKVFSKLRRQRRHDRA